MRWILWIGAAIAVLGFVVVCVGYLLPQNHEASRSAEFNRPPQDVYALVAEVANYPAWWSNITKVEMIDRPGQITFKEHMSTGPVIMTVVEQSPPSRFMTKIDDPGQPFGGTWTFEIAALGDGKSRLTITERGEIYNPIFRVMSRFVFGYTGTMESCLAALEKRLR
jgi:ribosome-associated toxin RatA of RatAB toxin-antitoxin module